MKNSIQKSLLAIMLLFGAMNIQSSSTNDGGKTTKGELLIAVVNDDTATVRKIISENPHLIHEKNHEGEDSLSLAIASNLTDIIEILIEFGADVNKKYQNGITPLLISVACQNIATTKLLIKHNADPYIKCDNGLDSITYAYFHKKPGVLQLFVETDNSTEKIDNLLREAIQKTIIQIRSLTTSDQTEYSNAFKSFFGKNETNTILQLFAEEIEHADIQSMSTEELTNVILTIIQSFPRFGLSMFNKVFIQNILSIISLGEATIDTVLRQHNENIKQLQSQLTSTSMSKLSAIKVDTNPKKDQLELFVQLIGLNLIEQYLIQAIHYETEPVKYNQMNKQALTETQQRLILQSKTTRPITFQASIFSIEQMRNIGNCILIPQEIDPSHEALILHEIGHAEMNSSQRAVEHLSSIASEIYHVLSSSTEEKEKLSLLLLTCWKDISLLKVDEYQADTFMLKSATKQQLLGAITFFEQTEELIYQQTQAAIPQLTFNKNKTLDFFHCFGDYHPKNRSRITRIQKRIKELDDKEKREREKLIEARTVARIAQIENWLAPGLKAEKLRSRL